MKLHAHHMSTTSRPIMTFCADQGIDCELVVVDIFSGEHMQEPYLSLNPNALIPTLDDDGFILTESSAILKYIADKSGSAAYPKDPQARARVNELMDWFNTNLYREIGYHVVYPQTFPNHARATDELTQSVVDWGLERTHAALAVLDGNWILGGSDGPFLTGADITIADYLGADLLACGDLIGSNWDKYPNVAAWLATMKARPGWKEVHEPIDGYAASIAEQSFTAIA